MMEKIAIYTCIIGGYDDGNGWKLEKLGVALDGGAR